MLLLIELSGAIGLLLFGLRQVRNGMMRSFGTSLKRLASRTEGRILPTFLVGLLVAVLLQSSAATAMISATFAAQGATANRIIFELEFRSRSERDDMIFEPQAYTD